VFGLRKKGAAVGLLSGGAGSAAGLFEREPAEGRNGRERGEDDGSEMAGWSMEKNRGRWLCQ